MKIVILDGATATQSDLNWDAFDRLGQVTVWPRTASEEVIERICDADAVLTNKVILGENEMDAAPRLRYIGVLATGYNVVDLKAATEHGIVVTNIPAYSTDSVAQMAIAHLLNIANGVGRHAEAVCQGSWQNSADFCFQLTPQMELRGKTFAVVGLGNTGMATARLAQALGMRVVAWSSKPAKVLRGLYEIEKAESLEVLFRGADVLSLHCPLTPDTHHLVNARSLSWMKPTAILLNTGRGPLVDDQALADALNEGRLYAAGVDVLEQEPPRQGSPLIGARNCFITPHIAWATREARKRLLETAYTNLKAFLNGSPQHVVNS